MSHVATVKCVVKDLGAFEAACKALEVDLGNGKKLRLKFKPNQKTYRWYGQWVNDYSRSNAAYLNGIKTEDYGKCEHAVTLVDEKGEEIPGAYEIGLVKNPNGPGFLPIFDFFAQSQNISRVVGGDDMRKLMQEYVLQVAERHPKIQQMKRQGYKAVRRLVPGTKTVQLVVAR